MLGFQEWITYAIRFILTGDLCVAWTTVDWLSAHMSHLCNVPNLAIAGNTATARTYDARIRIRAN